jgi:enterochelin esterase-like enzyme
MAGDRGRTLLEPQSTLYFVLLIVVFGGLTWWLIRARRVAVKVIAAVLSFAAAMAFGVLSVNKYFGYYQTWGAAVADFTNPSPNLGPEVSSGSLLVGLRSPSFDESQVSLRLAKLQGYTLHVMITGARSHITRAVYIYLPPQYFEPGYRGYKFPAIELLPGAPGEPQDWINVAGVEVTLNDLIDRGLAKPAVLIMPDANGSPRVSLQCLNQVHGPQDLTYLALDVPDVMSHMLRLQQPGLGWGVAGYSEGGFCAANMALRYRYRYGFAASLSGYFAPMLNKPPGAAKLVSPFGGNRSLRRANTPLDEVLALAPGALTPQFWLGAGTGDKVDVANAQYFRQELLEHEADVPLDLTPGGHDMGAWHTEIPPMISWMTNGLAGSVANLARIAVMQAHIAALARQHAVARHHQAKKKSTAGKRPRAATSPAAAKTTPPPGRPAPGRTP